MSIISELTQVNDFTKVLNLCFDAQPSFFGVYIIVALLRSIRFAHTIVGLRLAAIKSFGAKLCAPLGTAPYARHSDMLSNALGPP